MKQIKTIGAPRKEGDKKVNAGISTEQKKIDLLGAETVKRICKNAIDKNYEHRLNNPKTD